MNLEKISNLIKTKRKEKNLTQEELASRINVTEKAISRWETGRGTPDISLLVPLAKELDVSVSELLNGEENKNEEKNIKEIIDYIDINNQKKNKLVLITSIIIYAITLILYLGYLRLEYDVHGATHISYAGEFIYNIIFSLLIVFANYLISNYYYDKLEDKQKIKKISYIAILIIYIIMFLNLTVFGRVYGYVNYNLIPFKTIIHYFTLYKSNAFVVNFIGNIIILMPVAYLILKIFEIDNIKTNLLIDFLIVLCVESLQFITKTGAFDIDDIMLNLLGMSITYYLVKKNIKLNKLLLITSISSLIFTIIVFHNLSWHHIGDVPTLTVLFRLIFFFLITDIISYKLLNKIKK
ncbi:MAG: VanZ family protein [Bacilli bacterium]|nr:VanZ family protein [Bacilli bacterium]